MADDDDIICGEGYPTNHALDKIMMWDCKTLQDKVDLMAFVKSVWYYPETFRTVDDNVYVLATAGWAGNEDIIEAMRDNASFWPFCWKTITRGGEYEFVLDSEVVRERNMEDKEYVRKLAKRLKNDLPDDHGFLLLTFPFGENKDSKVHYTANCNREDAIKMLKNFLHRMGEEEAWMKHVK